DRHGFGEQRADLRVFALDEQGGRHPSGRSERDEVLAGIRAQADGHVSAERLRDIGQGASAQQGHGRDVRASRVPGEFANGQTVFWNAPADTVPESSGTCGRAGYSATGMVISENREDPQVTSTFASICSRVTSWFGRALEMSASSRPETRTVPAETTSAAISTREETS